MARSSKRKTPEAIRENRPSWNVIDGPKAGAAFRCDGCGISVALMQPGGECEYHCGGRLVAMVLAVAETELDVREKEIRAEVQNDIIKAQTEVNEAEKYSSELRVELNVARDTAERCENADHETAYNLRGMLRVWKETGKRPTLAEILYEIVALSPEVRKEWEEYENDPWS